MTISAERREELTQDRLKELLEYDQHTGVFRRRVSLGNTKAGSIAGCYDGRGYLKIWIDGNPYRTGRLAFLYMVGRWPKKHIDHINHIHDDDRWSNLREVSQKENNRNLSMRKDNNSATCTGVYWDKTKQRWRATIASGSRRYHLGYYENIDDAVAARQRASKYYGFHPNHGKPLDAGAPRAIVGTGGNK